MELREGETMLYEGRPSPRSILGYYLVADVLTVVVVVVAYLAVSTAAALVALVAVQAVVLTVGVLKRSGTHYYVTNDRLVVRRGLLSRDEQETALARVQDVHTRQSFLERVLKVGTVDFNTSIDDPGEFVFRGVEDPDGIVTIVHRAQRGSPSGNQWDGSPSSVSARHRG